MRAGHSQGGQELPKELEGHLAEELLWLKALRRDLRKWQLENTALAPSQADAHKVIQRLLHLASTVPLLEHVLKEKGETTEFKSLQQHKSTWMLL